MQSLSSRSKSAARAGAGRTTRGFPTKLSASEPMPRNKCSDEGNSEYGQPLYLLKLRRQSIQPSQQPIHNVECEARPQHEQRQPEIRGPIGDAFEALAVSGTSVWMAVSPFAGGMMKKLPTLPPVNQERDSLAVATPGGTQAQTLKVIPVDGNKDAPRTMLMDAVSINRPCSLPERMCVLPVHDVCHVEGPGTDESACRPWTGASNLRTARHQAAKSCRLESSSPVGIGLASFPTKTGGGGLSGTVTPAPTDPSSGSSRRPRWERRACPALTLNLKIDFIVFPIAATNVDNTPSPFSLMLLLQLPSAQPDGPKRTTQVCPIACNTQL